MQTDELKLFQLFLNLLLKFYRTSTVPISDSHWHHVGFTWSNHTGDWFLYIDGVLWAAKKLFGKDEMVPTGVLTIGKSIEHKITYKLNGNMSRVNLWSWAMSGRDIEDISKYPGSRNGDLIAWFMAKDRTSDLTAIRSSTASFSG